MKEKWNSQLRLCFTRSYKLNINSPEEQISICKIKPKEPKPKQNKNLKNTEGEIRSKNLYMLSLMLAKTNHLKFICE